MSRSRLWTMLAVLFAPALAFAVSAPTLQGPDQSGPFHLTTSPALTAGLPMNALAEHTTSLGPVAIEPLLLEDADRPAGAPLRIGIERDLKKSLREVGAWQKVGQDAWVWRGQVVSEGAASMRLLLSGLDLPQGWEALIYSPIHTETVYGPYKGRGLWNDSKMWTHEVPGDTVIVEVVPPTGSGDAYLGKVPPIDVLRVSHAYRDARGAPTDFDCHLDVTCYPDWATIKDSVGGMVFQSGGSSFVCTGTMLSTTDQSFEPYFLTAHHCISTQAVAQTMTVRWRYESQVCDGPSTGPTDQTLGSTYISSQSTTDLTDYCLLELTGTVPGYVVYSGWTTQMPAVGDVVTGIHHPAGSYKRYATFDVTNVNYVFINSDTNEQSTNEFVRCDTRNDGTTEGGSSGSGIWLTRSGNQYLFGQLFGGGGDCVGTSVYGRFDATFNEVSQLLDPQGATPTPTPSPTVTPVPESCSNGSSVTVGQQVSGTVTQADQFDYYTFTAPADGVYDFTLDHDPTDPNDFDYRLYATCNGGTPGSVIATGTSRFPTETIQASLQSGQQIFIQVLRFSGEGDYTLLIEVAADTPTPSPTSIPASDDTCSGAAPLSYSFVENGSLGPNDDVDFWTYPPLQNAIPYRLSVVHDTSLDIDVTVYDGCSGGVPGTAIGTKTTLANEEYIIFLGGGGLPFFYEVERVSGSGDYSIHIIQDGQFTPTQTPSATETPVTLTPSPTPTATIPPNNTDDACTGANPITLGQTIPDFISVGDAEDYFEVVVPDGAAYRLTMTDTSSADIDLDLYRNCTDQGATDLIDSARSGGDVDIVEFVGETGSLYLRVFRYSGEGTYTLEFEAQPTPPPTNTPTATPTLGPGDRCSTAMDLSLATPITGGIDALDIRDFFEFQAPQTGFYTFTLDSPTGDHSLEIYGGCSGVGEPQNLLARSITPGNVEQATVELDARNIVYIRLGYLGGGNGYTLSVDTASAPTNTPTRPPTNTPTSTPTVTATPTSDDICGGATGLPFDLEDGGAFTAGDTVDWWSYPTGVTGRDYRIRIWSETTGANYDLAVFDTCNGNFATGFLGESTSPDANETVAFVGESGRPFYFRVLNTSSTPGDYSIQIDYVPSPTATPTSTPTAPNGNVDCSTSVRLLFDEKEEWILFANDPVDFFSYTTFDGNDYQIDVVPFVGDVDLVVYADCNGTVAGDVLGTSRTSGTESVSFVGDGGTVYFAVEKVSSGIVEFETRLWRGPATPTPTPTQSLSDGTCDQADLLTFNSTEPGRVDSTDTVDFWRYITGQNRNYIISVSYDDNAGEVELYAFDECATGTPGNPLGQATITDGFGELSFPSTTGNEVYFEVRHVSGTVAYELYIDEDETVPTLTPTPSPTPTPTMPSDDNTCDGSADIEIGSVVSGSLDNGDAVDFYDVVITDDRAYRVVVQHDSGADMELSVWDICSNDTTSDLIGSSQFAGRTFEEVSFDNTSSYFRIYIEVRDFSGNGGDYTLFIDETAVIPTATPTATVPPTITPTPAPDGDDSCSDATLLANEETTVMGSLDPSDGIDFWELQALTDDVDYRVELVSQGADFDLRVWDLCSSGTTSDLFGESTNPSGPDVVEFRNNFAGNLVFIEIINTSGGTGTYSLTTSISIPPTPTPTVTPTPTITPDPVTVSVEFDAGWNSMGMPVVPANGYTVAAVAGDMAFLGLQAGIMARWHGSAWQMYLPGLPYNDFPMVLGEGYLAYMLRGGTMEFRGSPVTSPVPVQMSPGWNLISVPYTSQPKTISQFLNTVNAGQLSPLLPVAATIENGQWKLHVWGLPTPDFTLEPGRSYLVYSLFEFTVTP